MIKGYAKASNVADVGSLFDDNTFTLAKIKIPGRVVIDFGRQTAIDSVRFFSRNDENDVLPGNTYELLYYDNGWHSLGVKRSTGFSLKYENVPRGALYLLKKHDKGKEERIFTFQNGKQVWW